LEIFQDAASRAAEPEDIVRLACDMAAAHACMGRAQNSLEPLRNALDVLNKVHKAEILEADLSRDLTVEVHSRLGEAYHSVGDLASARTHYETASTLSPQPSNLEMSMRNLLRKDAGPELHCPGGGRKQFFHMPAEKQMGQAFKSKVAALLADGQHSKAEMELWSYLETQRQPYKSAEAADTLTTLGNLYLTPEKRSYYKAGHCFIKAMQASLSCCGARSQHSKNAYKGLSFVKGSLPRKQQATAAALIQQYLSATEMFSNSANDLGQKVRVAADGAPSDHLGEFIKV
jgi:tetratricopeptide (TPR) repeat protein